MKKNKSISGALAVLTGLLVSTNASAKDHKPRTSDNQAKVIAHMTFAGQTPLNMALKKQGDDKYYLYIQQNNESIAVVDVAKPTRPKAISQIADPTLVSAVNLSGNLAIVQTQMPAMADISAKDDLVFWDLSNPTAPRVVQKFSGVVKWLQDERNFVYVLNNEGLWVISQPDQEQFNPDPMAIPLYQ